MSAVQTRADRQTTLGRGSTTVETPTTASRTVAAGARTVNRSETRPEIAVTRSETRPELTETSAAPLHAGVAFQFTLSLRPRQA